MNPKNRFSVPCLFCGSDEVGRGEHIIPSWLIKDGIGNGPYTIFVNQSPVTKRDSTEPRPIDALPGAHAPVCAGCNNELNKNFEERGKPLVRRLLQRSDPARDLQLSTEDMTDLARWLLKVALLAGHPSAEHDDTKAKKSLPKFHMDNPKWFSWMTDGCSIPDGFSVFVSRWDQSHVNWQESPTMTIDLPHLLVDDMERPFTHHSISIADLYVTIVWHPHWPIKHQQVVEGRAIQLWPALKACDLSSLPLVSPNELVFRNNEEVVGMASDELSSLQNGPLSVERSSEPYTGIPRW